MAILHSNQAVRGLSGRVGNLVFRQCKGQVVVARRPRRSELPPTERALAHQDHFRRGVCMACHALSDPEKRARYEKIARGRRNRVFGLAVSDAMRSPEIKSIDLDTYQPPQGVLIYIDVVDVAVDTVQVLLRLRDGTVFANEPAQPGGGRGWWYRPATAIPPGQLASVEVTARDLAGNETWEVLRCDAV